MMYSPLLWSFSLVLRKKRDSFGDKMERAIMDILVWSKKGNQYYTLVDV